MEHRYGRFLSDKRNHSPICHLPATQNHRKTRLSRSQRLVHVLCVYGILGFMLKFGGNYTTLDYENNEIDAVIRKRWP